MNPEETLKSRVYELADEIQDMRSNIGDLEAEIDELEEEISEKESKIAQLLTSANLETITVADCFTYIVRITGEDSVYIDRRFARANT